MDEKKWQAEKFEANRPHLRAVAYRMLGSRTEAEDAVQEAWLRLNRANTSEIDNLGGWLTTVTARICLDWLRSRKSRREEPLTIRVPEPVVSHEAGNGTDPEQEALLTDSVGLALLVILEKLTPAERLAFVLHDMFDMAFDDIAPIVGRSTVATRQLASRARRRVQGVPVAAEADLSRQRHVVDAFFAASRNGDMTALLTALDPDVVFRADAVATRMGALAEIRGNSAVAETFRGRAQGARLAVINGAVGAVVILGGQLRIALRITMADDGRIIGIDAMADPEQLRKLEVLLLDP
ncbi:sigma-70 family RNA polymerase sigma factor [Rhizobium rhizogenes]|uniref:RNA polymerase sigma factor protein n=1 Tax=Rhizobium rhizogenes (strain K84 / ATCC BAA-868) TaxID=311403 RepID=B9J8U8_RHIR8|nr:sigma-70 family RNA polymerase sigma factor [Rhizobium rhizogenes]ACM27486.1 RNA polymerase sigma factor protein [Rhizobium rhizogenes K84]NTF82087.1 sigma-70 family RNA polymerase sigma factor [Rhizobium rhizogenes]NTH78104.1 sigma-70 family RNA polymerase sigma factor [Rhizobium rhizogenes]NTH84112.1 sigma-70 family RNA polymerase sigma factor [Rhizobium rhizogenes]NTI23231.1 sigma-70 family RNA polymerase sigma factor [Rhizobium rhizogenes]